MKRLAIIVICLTLVGCATVLVVEERDIKGNLIRSIRAEDYSVKTPTLTAVPSRWLTPAFVGEIIKGAIGWKQVTSYIPEPNPANIIPTPTPTPAPGPYPAPVPTPTPVPGPTPPPIASSVFSVQGSTITLDMNTLPGSMRAAGMCEGSDNSCYYVMAFIYNYGTGDEIPDDKAGSNAWAQGMRRKIYDWFDGEVVKVAAMMKANPTLTLVAISNDGPDRCGFRLAPNIVQKMGSLGGFTGRVSYGYMMPPEEY